LVKALALSLQTLFCKQQGLESVMKDQPLELGGESPYAAYRLLSFTFNGALLSVAFSKAAKGAFSTPMMLTDFGMTAAATHKLAQIISSERVTMYLRSPFTWQRDEGRKGERKEIPKEHGLHRALGELLTCPYCLAPWISSALIAGHIFAPVPTRVVTTIFAATAAADWLSQLKAKLNEVAAAKSEPAKSEPAPRVVSVVS
jgi:hypothetical protein